MRGLERACCGGGSGSCTLNQPNGSCLFACISRHTDQDLPLSQSSIPDLSMDNLTIVQTQYDIV